MENKEQENEFYYKGFEHEVDKFGNHHWYDKNNVIRKTISYRGDGTILSEEYFDDKALPHNEDGPAYQEWDRNGALIIESYMLHGKNYNERQWKAEVVRLKTNHRLYGSEPDNKYTSLEDFLIKEQNIPDTDKYYKGFRHEEGLEYGDDRWYDENNVLRKRNIFFKNRFKASTCFFNHKNEHHNEDGPAFITWAFNGKATIVKFYLNGIELTEDEWKRQTGKIKSDILSLTEKEIIKDLNHQFDEKYSKPELPDYLNPESDNYYKGFRCEPIDVQTVSLMKKVFDSSYEMTILKWSDENSNIRKIALYNSQGVKLREIFFNENFQIHNEDGYADVSYSPTTTFLDKGSYYLNGQLFFSKKQWEEATDNKSTLEKCWYNKNGELIKKIFVYDKY